jgi:hypothetical protein
MKDLITNDWELIAGINAAHARCMEHTIEAVRAAGEAGVGLIKLKESAGHGNWSALFDKGALPFSERTAQRYMAIGRAIDKREVLRAGGIVEAEAKALEIGESNPPSAADLPKAAQTDAIDAESEENDLTDSDDSPEHSSNKRTKPRNDSKKLTLVKLKASQALKNAAKSKYKGGTQRAAFARGWQMMSDAMKERLEPQVVADHTLIRMIGINKEKPRLSLAPFWTCITAPAWAALETTDRRHDPEFLDMVNAQNWEAQLRTIATGRPPDTERTPRFSFDGNGEAKSIQDFVQELKHMVNYASKEGITMERFDRTYRQYRFRAFADTFRNAKDHQAWYRALCRVADAETWEELNL